ncbi:hypothetical protein LK994_05130 [Ferruginibacter lapsinanis]|uniref:hypothetical protein n=1 Tax=Ferruginibacter lapsinanis TaxID=563172 RepID=UPI001E49A675|nr:hypothetical protein [Ferruginibacter lapsinanis]UEG50857.1 hypothetical protein LK994_05130 [Ferruginibacter lapsinanis]
MSLFRVVIELFAFYLLYKLIFDFIIPVAKTTKQVKKQFGDMHSQMQEKMNQYNREQPSQASTVKSSAPKPDKADYIEFEEMK